MTRTEGGVAGRFVMGLTNKPVEKLSPIARSWLQAPEIHLTGGAYTSSGYSLNQRAFIMAANRPGSGATLELKIAATEESPVVNPAFVIKDWGQSGARLKIDGKKIKRGGDFRFGHYHKLNGSDLIVWIKKEATKPVTIILSAAPVE